MMAGLLDMIQQRRAIAAQTAAQTAQVQGGAFSTAQPPLPELDQSTPMQGASPADQDVENATTGMVPRLLTAGGHDLAGGLDNAMAATAAALGGDVLAGKLHSAAAEHAQRAEALTPDQPKSWSKDVNGIGDALKFGATGLVRGLPMIGAMAGGGVLARSMGAPALAGVAAPSMALNTGSAYSELADQPGVDPRSAGVHALAAGAVNAGIDTLAFGYAAKLSPFAKQELAKAVSGSLSSHVAKSLATEGLAGATREFVNKVAVNHILENPDIFSLSPEDRTAITDAAAQNIAATAPLGVAGHFGGRVGAAIDKTIDAAGGAVRKVRGADVPNAGTNPPDSGTPAAPIGERAGQAAGAAVRAVADAVKTRFGFKGMADAAKQPEEPGVKKSQAGALTYDAKLIRGALEEAAPNASRNDATLLAKRVEQLFTTSPAKFNDFTNQPEVAAHIKSTFDMTPEEFRQHITDALVKDPKSNLRDKITAQQPDKMAQEGQLYDRQGHEADNLSAEDGAHLANIDHSDVLNAINSPDETGARHPGMTPEMFGSFLTTKRQADAGSKAGGNAWVNVTRTTKDPATGEVKGTETTPKQINFVNLSKKWAPQRELSEKAAMFGERSQQKFDNNFKDGLSAMLNGWHETDEKGNPVDVTVQPARQSTENGHVTAVDKADMGGWLRPDSVVGTNGKPRTMADVEASGRVTAATDLPGAIDQYHEAVSAVAKKSKEAVMKAGGDYNTKEGSAIVNHDVAEASRKAAGPVVRMAVEKIKDGLDGLEPQRQQEVIQAAIDYASDPAQRPIPKDVPSMLRMLPDEVLQHGKARLISELSDMDAKVVQPRLKGEQETSVDNPDVANAPQSTEKPGPVTEDLAGQHITYAKPGPEKLAVPSASKDEALANLKRIRAQATTEVGKRMLERAMQVAAKQPMSQAEYARLANPELKASDVQAILDAERSRIPAGRSGVEAEAPKA
jgi:hypothetical protein